MTAAIIGRSGPRQSRTARLRPCRCRELSRRRDRVRTPHAPRVGEAGPNCDRARSSARPGGRGAQRQGLALAGLEQLLLFGDHFLDSATKAGVVHAPTIAPSRDRSAHKKVGSPPHAPALQPRDAIPPVAANSGKAKRGASELAEVELTTGLEADDEEGRDCRPQQHAALPSRRSGTHARASAGCEARPSAGTTVPLRLRAWSPSLENRGNELGQPAPASLEPLGSDEEGRGRVDARLLGAGDVLEHPLAIAPLA